MKVSTNEGKAAVTWITERYAENLVSVVSLRVLGWQLCGYVLDKQLGIQLFGVSSNFLTEFSRSKSSPWRVHEA